MKIAQKETSKKGSRNHLLPNKVYYRHITLPYIIAKKGESLRTWGCLAFAQIPKERRMKFEPRGVKCTMVGYNLEKKAWRLMRLDNQQIITTCRATFMESVFPYKVKKQADMIVEYLVPGGITNIKDFDFEDYQHDRCF